ncbi:hypothetical protein HO173_012547 [Letharia columbiana]|uniref:Uncharacterized protein n=1 Tax=Letharia columbiana TaxID=112416 RepID=A0A8H6FF01_9LECA|nr:uncharacterized protein HO173_012547 [Letharia columbiana]KAF6226057.1 hypothetical protein HO173_012547 [Letharia columbiana]
MPGQIGSETSASDATRFHASDTTNAHDEGQTSPSDDGSIEKMPGPSKRKRLSGLSRRTRAKTRNLFKMDGAAEDDRSENEGEGPLDDMKRDPAFNSSQLIKKKRFRPGKTADKTLGAIQSIGNAVVHPIKSAKSTATRTTAGQLSKAERPFLSQKADMEFLQAHDNLKRAESTSSSKQGTSDEERESLIGGHRDKIREMEEQREGLRAAWTTSRHVRRVRVVPKRHINFPHNEYFVERDERGEFVRYDWLKWLGYNLIYYTQDFSAQYIDDFEELPFDIDSSRHYVERLIMASAPWQSWAMKVRAVYRWEHPRTTGEWFALYVFLWYTQHIMGFLYSYIIYIVVMNRYYPTTVESLRKSQRRAFDSSVSANMFSELIDKHGRNDWLDPVMDSLGPYVQLQLGDMANMLEVFSNFYHWKHPKKTVASLYFFASCLLVSVLTDMEFCMQIVWFIVGGAFFLCWPVSSHYPKYRYLVSPFKWVLWDIPTNAEWSFIYLRRKAQITRERIIEKKVEEGHFRELASAAVNEYTGRMTNVPKIKVGGSGSEDENSDDDDDEGWYSACSTTSVLDASDIRSFRCQSHKVIGRLIIHSKGIRFVRSLPKKELWRRDYLDLAEMRKVEGSAMSKLASLSPDELEIKCIDGSKMHFEGMKERDEAFNTVIAYSGMQWQSLQILSNTKAQS